MSTVSKKFGFALLVVSGLMVLASAQRPRKAGAGEQLVGAWHLVRVDASEAEAKSAAGPQPTGMLVYTRDGHMSVQLMYPTSASTLSNEYVRNGYEASFGSYDVDEATHTVTHHVLGSITGDLLVGKDLPRRFEFTADGHLLIRSTRPDEHWSATWERYEAAASAGKGVGHE